MVCVCVFVGVGWGCTLYEIWWRWMGSLPLIKNVRKLFNWKMHYLLLWLKLNLNKITVIWIMEKSAGWKLNKWKTINKLPVAGNLIVILLGYYIIVATTCFLLKDVILLWSVDCHSGSSMNSIHTGIIDMCTNLAPANNSTIINCTTSCIEKGRDKLLISTLLFYFINCPCCMQLVIHGLWA